MASIMQTSGGVGRGLLAATVLFAVPLSSTSAQESDMASRMILELQQMREEVRELRGMVESQSQEIENLKRRQRDQYIDLDRRLSAQPRTAAAGPGEVAREADRATVSSNETNGVGTGSDDSGRPIVVGDIGPSGALPTAPADRPEVRQPMQRMPEITTLAEPAQPAQRELQPPTEAEQRVYDQAFLALRETRYVDAAEGFDRFLRDYPNSSYAPNAQYWLGEVYYVTRDFETALAQFQDLMEKYPDSSKQPDALLKIGFSYYELEQWDRARAALEQVVADYPGTNYSRLAENRLRTMRLEGHL
ncbi:MAG: tol-pal system protein YbgF [Wenzhouxiangellaceae bacterium]|nr:tol-pal system protein YbgF [Wenzhouxiangellaceae bacterium]